MLISEDDGRSPAACRPAEHDGFRIRSSGRAGTRLEYQDSVRAAPPWSGATDADSHLDPAPAGSNRAEFAAVRARIIAAADDARRRIARDLHDGCSSNWCASVCGSAWPGRQSRPVMRN